MKKVLFIVMLFLLFSCSNNFGDMDVFDTHIDIKLENNSGGDLLNPDSNNTYNQDTLKLIYLLNGQEQYYFCTNCDYQKGYYFFVRDNSYVIRIFPNVEIQQDNSEPITYIQWNDTDRDTVQCHIERNENGSSIVCTKVWYNDTLVWDNNGERYFTIVKD